MPLFRARGRGATVVSFEQAFSDMEKLRIDRKQVSTIRPSRLTGILPECDWLNISGRRLKAPFPSPLWALKQSCDNEHAAPD